MDCLLLSCQTSQSLIFYLKDFQIFSVSVNFFSFSNFSYLVENEFKDFLPIEFEWLVEPWRASSFFLVGEWSRSSAELLILVKDDCKCWSVIGWERISATVSSKYSCEDKEIITSKMDSLRLSVSELKCCYNLWGIVTANQPKKELTAWGIKSLRRPGG